MRQILHAFFYKQNIYKQHQNQIGKKNKQKLSNTLRLNFRSKCQKNKLFFQLNYMINCNENEDNNGKTDHINKT